MLDLKKLKVGEKISYTDYFTVNDITKDSISVLDKESRAIYITGKKLIESKFYSNSQFNKTMKIGKNELAQKLLNTGDKIFTVCFTKANNEKRILIGHFHSAEPFLGRTNVIDLEVASTDKTKGHRLIDNRTIQWLVTDNIKYIAQ